MDLHSRAEDSVTRDPGTGGGQMMVLMTALVLCFCTAIYVTRHPREQADGGGAADPGLQHDGAPCSVTRDTLRKGESLYLSLKGNALSDGQIHELTQALAKVFTVRKVHPGDYYAVARDSAGAVQRFEYVPDVEYAFIAEREADGLAARRKVAALNLAHRGVHGVITDCFHNAIISLGEGPQLMWTFAGWKGGYGRLVVIRHNHSCVTRYGHLSRFAKGIRKGVRVRQKDLIGYVGSSGRSTGPHLHCEMERGGRLINPLRENFPAADPVPESCRADFERVLKEWLEALDRLGRGTRRLAGASGPQP